MDIRLHRKYAVLNQRLSEIDTLSGTPAGCKRTGDLEVYDVECAGRNRRYYKITDAGRAQLLLYRREWADYSSKISLLFSGEEIK